MSKFYNYFRLCLLGIICMSSTIGMAQQTSYEVKFKELSELPKEWQSNTNDYKTSLVEDIDPYTEESTKAVKIAYKKTSEWGSFRVTFATPLDLSANPIVAIKLRSSNANIVHGGELRICSDNNNGKFSGLAKIVFTEGYNWLVVDVSKGGSNFDITNVTHMTINPSSNVLFKASEGEIYVESVHLGTPFEMEQVAAIYNAFPFETDIDNGYVTIDGDQVVLNYWGKRNANQVRIYMAESNGANIWTKYYPDYGKYDYDKGFESTIESYDGSVKKTYHFSSKRLDANILKNIPTITGFFNNAIVTNAILEAYNHDVLAYFADKLEASYTAGVITLDDGVTVKLTNSTHTHIALNGQVTYPAQADGNATGALTLTLEENNIKQDLNLNIVVAPEQLTGVYMPTLFANSQNQNIVLAVAKLTEDLALSENITFEFRTDNAEIITDLSHDYKAGDASFVVTMTTKATGAALLYIDVKDNGELKATFPLGVQVISAVTHQNKGIRYVATDVEHWQPRPYKTTPTIKPGFPISLNESKLYGTNLDFFHGIMSGILLPPTSGEYEFRIKGEAEGWHAFWLAEGLDYTNFPEEKDPTKNPTNHTAKRAKTEDGEAEDAGDGKIYLEAGKPYYFEAHNRQVVNEYVSELLWKRPGETNFTPILDAYVVQFLDQNAPTAVAKMNAEMGEKTILLNWEAASDDQEVKGYHLFVNGKHINTEIIEGTSYTINGLEGDTNYEIYLYAQDAFGNFSAVSAKNVFKTAAYNPNPAALPATLTQPVLAAYTSVFEWEKGENAFGYNLYLNGELVNQDPITGLSYAFENLEPNTAYTFALKSLNTSFLESETALEKTFTTLAFDLNNEGERKLLAEVSFTLDAIAKSTGLGLNVDFKKTDLMQAEPELFNELMNELAPAGLRFGAIPSNTVSYSEVSGPNSKFISFGQYAQSSIDFGGKYVMLTVGPGENTDYTKNPTETFTKLMEYLCGPADSVEGKKRADEGFTEPFTTQLEGIIIELGNEVWGEGEHGVPNHTSYENDYFPWVEEATAAITASPYYDANKIHIGISGRKPDMPTFHHSMFDHFAESETPYVITLSGYVGGNIMDSEGDIEETDIRISYHKDSYKLFAENLGHMERIRRDAIYRTGKVWAYYPYESNSTTNNYHGSYGQALLLVDYLYEYVKRGANIPSIFNLEGGQWKIIDRLPDGTVIRRPLFHLAAVANKFTRNATVLESQVAANYQLTDSEKNTFELAPIGFHSINKGNEYSLMFFNREYENDFKVKVNLPEGIGEVSNAKMTMVNASSYEATEVSIQETAIEITDGMILDVPKHAMIILTFNANALEVEAPLFAIDYTKVESINIHSVSDKLELTDADEYLEIETTVVPQDAFAPYTTLEIIEGGETGAIIKNGREIYPGVKNGTIKVRATADSDKNVHSNVLEIVINKQSLITDADQAATLMKVYPNPASDLITIASTERKELSVMIYTLEGKLCATHQVHEAVNHISTASLQNGIYIIRIKGDGVEKTQKLMIIK